MSQAFELIAQQFVYTTLNGQIAGVDIYDHVPYTPEGRPNVQFPYVQIGEGEMQEWDTDETVGAYIFVDVHVWSRLFGMTELKTIIGQIRSLLHRQTATESGHKILDCLNLSSSAVLDPDGKTRHGIASYRLTIQEIS